MRDVISIGRKMLRVFSLLTFVWATFASLAVAQNVAATAGQGARLEGKVCTATGEPIGDALVQLHDSQQGPGLEVRTDAGGKYALTVTKAGRYELRASQNGLAPAAVQSVELANGETKHLDMVLTKESAAGRMQFSDEPNFTVAGVTDWSNVGLHGSDTNVRTGETLAKETAAIKSDAPTGKSANSDEADAHRLSGDAKEKSGDPVAAVNEYAKAVQLDPSEANYFAWGAELLLHRGGAATIEVFTKGAKAHPQSARMFAGLGAAYYFDGEFPKAAETFCVASDLQPRDPSPYLFLGRMEKSSSETFPCAEQRLRRFANDQPQNASAHYYYGVVLWKKARKSQAARDFQDAEKSLKNAAVLEPGNGEVYVQLGMLYNARGEKTAALDSFQRAVAVNPKLADGHYQLSIAYRQSGSLDKAESEMKAYQELKKADDAELQKQRKASQQFVTILKGANDSAPK